MRAIACEPERDRIIPLTTGCSLIVPGSIPWDVGCRRHVNHGGLCYLLTVDGKVYHVQAADAVNHLDALNKLTNTYIEASYVSRSSSNDIKTLIYNFPDLAALVVFPKYTIEQVIQIARAKRALPAGITRFLIPGRIMRLNADLAYLRSDRPLTDKNLWLYTLTMEKSADDQVRYYQEPVYLMDE